MRTIVEEERYQQEIDALRIDWQRLDEALTSLTQAVATVPEIFPQVPGTNLRRILVIGFKGVPPLSVFFSATETQVIIHSAQVIEQD